MNKYKIFADSVVLIHLLIFLTILTSLPMLFVNYRLGLMLSIVAVVSPLSWVVNRDRCIFTIWENRLRSKYDNQKTYNSGCVVSYLYKWFGIKATDLQVNIFLWSYLVLVVFTAIALKQ